MALHCPSSSLLSPLARSRHRCVAPRTPEPFQSPMITARQRIRSTRRPILLPCRSSGKPPQEGSFTDRILDYIEGGPKLRRWYGAPDTLPRDGGLDDQAEEPPGEDEDRDTVLVTDGESELGQLVILSLILKRAKIKALVRDKRSAKEAFGTYVELLVGDAYDKAFQKRALRRVQSIILLPNEGFFSSSAVDMKGIQHVVLLSQLDFYRNSTGMQAIWNKKARELAQRAEEAVAASGVPYTIINTGALESTPGGNQGFDFTKGAAAKGRISKEDAAKICVEALAVIPENSLNIEVVNGKQMVLDWKVWFEQQVSNRA